MELAPLCEMNLVFQGGSALVKTYAMTTQPDRRILRPRANV